MKYFNLLYLCETTGQVKFDLHFVEPSHRYTNILYLMCAASYNASTNYIVPESVEMTDLFDNAVGDREHEDPDDIVLSESVIEALETYPHKREVVHLRVLCYFQGPFL